MCAQISHHPPRTAFLVVAPDGEYTFSGVNEPAVSFRMNCLKNKSQGKKRFQFADGSEVQLLHPDYKMSNILYGDLRGAGLDLSVDRKYALTHMRIWFCRCGSWTGLGTGEISGNAYLIDEKHKMRVVLRFGEQDELPSDAFSGTLERLIPIEAEGRDGGRRVTDKSSQYSRSPRRFFSRARSLHQSDVRIQSPSWLLCR